jgi:hypothetical protein
MQRSKVRVPVSGQILSLIMTIVLVVRMQLFRKQSEQEEKGLKIMGQKIFTHLFLVVVTPTRIPVSLVIKWRWLL